MNTTTETLNLWKTIIFKNRINDFVRTVIRTDVPSVPWHKAPPELSPAQQLNCFTLSTPLQKEGGDFFLMAEKNGESLICLGDALGHGSQAARLAEEMLRILSLILKKVPAGSPAYLMKYCNFLFHVNNRLSSLFNKTSDLSICRIDHHNMTLHYCSAKINLILVRNGTALPLEHDRVVIGDASDTKFAVRNYLIHLEKDDLLFLHTDGITDQFGGAYDRKLGSRSLMEFLESLGGLNIRKIEERTGAFLKQWGQGREQTDDSTLIGIRF